MSPEFIVNFTAAVSIALAFLEPTHFNLVTAQTMQEQRIERFDRIIVGCRMLLETCGRTKFLASIFSLWSQTSQSLCLLERTLWPGQPAETPLHLNLPTEGRPLTEILLDNFDPYVDSIFNAIPALDSFTTWFTQNYDTALHAEFHEVLLDSMLLFRSAENILRMKRRFRALSPQEPLHDPVAVDEPAPAALPAADVPAADEPAVTNPASAPSSTGTTLEFY